MQMCQGFAIIMPCGLDYPHQYIWARGPFPVSFRGDKKALASYDTEWSQVTPWATKELSSLAQQRSPDHSIPHSAANTYVLPKKPKGSF